MFGNAYCYPSFFASRKEGSGRRGRSSCASRSSRGWGDEQRTPRGDIKYILLALLAGMHLINSKSSAADTLKT